MRARGRFAVIFFAASVVASLALLAGACGRGRERAARQTVSRAATAAAPERRELSPLPRRELSQSLVSARARAMRAASAARGLRFKSEPGMTELTGWEYGTRAGEMTALLGGDELRSLSRLAVAGGLLPEGTDLATLAAGFTAASSAAIYSPLDRRVLLLSDGGPKPGRRADESLLAHELTHALQDQHFDLLRLLTERPYNFDRAEAAFAVIEGDAVAVQRRVERGAGASDPSPEEAARAEDARFAVYRREFGALFPPLLTETFVFRYRDGVRFVETARRRGGGARAADELFRRPPASSEQVLHPEKYFADERPRDVRLDEAGFAGAGWRLLASTPLGEIGVRGLLLKGLNRREAERAAAGWGGDRAYLFERGGGAASELFVWRTVWDTAGDAQEFFRAYSHLERGRGAAGDAGETPGGAGTAQTVWRSGSLLTVVRAGGDSVTVVRGREAEVRAALELARDL
jgi:hypothetical protein